MTIDGSPPKKLHGGHFAFMRALAQGLDERTSWERYLGLEGEHSDLRHVRRTIAWIRDTFAAAAKREHRPGTARLLLLDPDRFARTSALPSLSEFAEAQGLDGFSEAEQLEAYEDAHPGAARQGEGSNAARYQRRRRVIERQLEALRWLQGLAAQDPRPGDGVGAWLHPVLARRLELAGLPTLDALVAHINRTGNRWWAGVPGVAGRKAARVLDWLRQNEDALGLHLGAHATTPRARLAPAQRAALLPPATALRPYEKFLLPRELDGSAGAHRAPGETCLLMVTNDHDAIGAWLASQRPGHDGGVLSSTQRAYRKEAERLLLWAILQRGKALSSLSSEDATLFRSFLTEPPQSWCGPRHNQRWSPLWRPFEGPLTASALRQALIILRSLFAFLVTQRYVTENPFSGVALPPSVRARLGADRTLSLAQWDHVLGLLRMQVDTEVGRRLGRAMRWLYATGLRLAELTQATCDDLEQVEYRADDAAMVTGWLLSVTGRSGVSRQVPVPHELVDELGEELSRYGFERQVGAIGNRDIRILSRFDTGLHRPVAWSASGLYQSIKAFLATGSEGMDDADAVQLKKASSHWLRHSHGAHALRGGEGQMPVPVEVVRNNLGHARVSTTLMYRETERDVQMKAMQQFWKAGARHEAP